MKVLPLVPLAIALAVPSSPSDITITTRSSYGPNVNGVVETLTVQMRGMRQRMARRTELPRGMSSYTYTTIAQCDLDQVVSINEAARLYAVQPVVQPKPLRSRDVVVARRVYQDTRPAVEIQTIDAVDTGERRTYGPFTARHVVTTTTAEREGAPLSVTNVRDGWYIDLPLANCAKPDGMAYALVGSVERGGRIDVRIKGRARTGFPIEERERHAHGAERTVTLVEFSQAPIQGSLFEVPDGYHRALELPFGGYDLSRPDTLWNRASAYWTMASSWARQWWQ
jgi:hypothetical protein